MFNDCWEAGTSDGREWREDDPVLQVPEHSPWRELEALCQREELRLSWAQVCLPGRVLRFAARGRPLTCGELLEPEMSLTSDAPATCTRYRWVRRDEIGRRVWGIIGAAGSWQYETAPGEEACPSPR